MKDELISRALAVGFAQCRIAPADSPKTVEDFQKWIAEGNHGEMAWLERGAEKRGHPQLVLPGAQSIIVLATSYFQGAERPLSQGKIARYAWGRDYHDLIAPRLQELVTFLESHGGTQKAYTDTGPILERDFAVEAGIGWWGKSTMTLNAELGTWFFLSVILTTLSLARDQPQPARCGTCTRCLQACPTGALEGPLQLNARKCISYLTIENKGPIPIEFRRQIGARIYGCDDCLDACPWNRFAVASHETEFQATHATSVGHLRDYLGWSEEEFRRAFRGSPIKRIKHRGFLRNVCVALGNVGNWDDLPALEIAAENPEPLIAEHAQWALREILRRHPAAEPPPVGSTRAVSRRDPSFASQSRPN